MSGALSAPKMRITPFLDHLRDNRLRVGILHSGGPANGGNIVIANAARPFIDRGIDVVGFRNGYKYLVGGRDPKSLIENVNYYMLTPQLCDKMLQEPGLLLGSARANPGKPIKSAADLEDPSKMTEVESVLNAFEYFRIGAFISVGGDDTMRTGNIIYRTASALHILDRSRLFAGNMVHVPKTIDNDYHGIDFTFGYVTASDVASDQIKRFIDDSIATSRIKIIKVMGRAAGYIVALAGMKGGAFKTLIPEEFTKPIDYDLIVDKLAREIIGREDNNIPNGAICFGEGFIEMLSEEKLIEVCKASGLPEVPRDSFGHIEFGKIPFENIFAESIKKRYAELKKEHGGEKLVDGTQPHFVGYDIRQNPVNAYDYLITTGLGYGAFELLANGHKGEMVTIQGAFNLSNIGFEDLIDPVTLKVRNRNVAQGSFLYRILAEKNLLLNMPSR